LSILADLDEVAVGITQVATPFPAMIVERFGKKECALSPPFFVAGPDVGDTQVEETIDSVDIRGCFEDDLRLIGSRTTPGIQDDLRVGQLDVARIFRFDHFPAKNADIEVLGFFLNPLQ